MRSTVRNCVTIAAFASLLGVATLAVADNSATPATLSRPPTVSVAPATESEVVARISVVGTLVAREEVYVNTRLNGFAIETINVEEGDRVAAGDVLAVLDNASLAAQLAQADAELARSIAALGQAQSQIDSSEASLREATASLSRTRQLKTSGTISQASLDQGNATAESARAAVAAARNGLKVAEAQRVSASSQQDLARLNLSRTAITAPVDGIVAKRTARLGDIATAGSEPMFRLIENGDIEIEVEVIETELGAIHPGDRAIMAVAGVGETRGTVRLLSPTVDQRSRVGTVRISLTNAPLLRAGVSAAGWIVTGRRQSVTVPSSAVLTNAGKTFVQVVNDATVEQRPVTAGLLSENGQREVLAGLQRGERVIVKAGAFFSDGDKVTPIDAVSRTADGKNQ